METIEPVALVTVTVVEPSVFVTELVWSVELPPDPLSGGLAGLGVGAARATPDRL